MVVFYLLFVVMVSFGEMVFFVIWSGVVLVFVFVSVVNVFFFLFFMLLMLFNVFSMEEIV